MFKNRVLTGLFFSPEQMAGSAISELATEEVAAAVGDGVETQGEQALVFNPAGCMNEQAIAKAIFDNVDWNKTEPVEGPNGTYHVTRAHNFVFKPGDGFRYQMGVSVIRRMDKGANASTLTRAQQKAIDTLGADLSPDDREHLTKLLTLKKQDGTKGKAIEKIANLR